MSETRRIRTVLYDDERVEATELDLIHTPALQRLYELHQLGLTDRVFIDASHSRLHHVVGVLQQVENLTAAVRRNLRNSPERVLKYRDRDGRNVEKPAREMAGYVERRRRAVRLMGLLHDLTHSPYGHTLEDEIHLIQSKHDEPGRQAEAFYRLLCQFIGWVARDIERIESRSDTTRWPLDDPRPELTLEQFLDAPYMPPPDPTELFITHLGNVGASFLKEESTARALSREPGCRDMETFFRDLYFAMRGLLYLDVLHKSEPAAHRIPSETRYPFERVLEAVLEKAGRPIRPTDRFLPHRDAFLLDIIGNTICADLLDYAKRDSHYTGLKLDYDEKRIVDNFTLDDHFRSSPPVV
jgi:HD superfamily phosphohydrolase